MNNVCLLPKSGARDTTGKKADAAPTPRLVTPKLGDFTTDWRVLAISLLAVVIGSIAVGVAWVLLRLIMLITDITYFGCYTCHGINIGNVALGPGSIAIPVIGSLVVGLMARYGSEKIRGHGIPEAMEAILIGQSRIQPKVAVLKPLSSAISIGTGGPFGAEGPIIMTGGAIGSLFAQFFDLTSAERKTLLVAGASAGMTAVFGTPLASILIAVELLLFEWKPRSFIPVAAACIAAMWERHLVIGVAPLFPFAGSISLSIWAVFVWALIGLACGLGSGLLTGMVYAAEDAFTKLPIHWMWWPAFGGLVVGIGGLFAPEALGVGYDNIRHLLAGQVGTPELLRLLFVKAIIWSVALGSGTSGGVLAPLLIMGGAAGALLAMVLHTGHPDLLALVGMAAMMGGTMRSPLTATVFAIELTGDFDALLPLLTACIVAHAVTVLWLKRSILTEKVARRGHHVLREYEVDPFDLTPVSQVMVTEVETLPADMPLDEVLRFFGGMVPRYKAYPVVDAEHHLVGLMTRDHALRWTRDRPPPERRLRELLAGEELPIGYPEEMVGALADRMVLSGAGRVPIVDPSDLRLVGMVARKDLLRVRAQMMAEEQERRAYLRWRRPRMSEAPSPLAGAGREEVNAKPSPKSAEARPHPDSLPQGEKGQNRADAIR
jgi:CIC family chloride channel protein